MSERARRRAANAATQQIVSAEQTPVAPPAETNAAAPKSIRSLIMSGILAGKTTKELTVEVQAHFPGTAAAAKSTKHIAWYRSRMKKDGLLTKVEPSTAS